MNNNIDKKAVSRFMHDTLMSDSVYQTLLDSFLKKREGDVNLKAAQMLAIDMFTEGWRDLERMKEKSVVNNKGIGQIGM